MVDYTIENVIVTTEVKADLKLKKIASSLDGVEFDPTRFPGIVFTLNEPKTATFLLKNGKAVCTGGRSFKESRQAIEKVVKMIKDTGVTVKEEPDIEIKNIIVSLELQAKINLNDVAELYNWKNVSYEPEVFPGLVYTTEIKNVELLLFDSGKLVCHGAKKLSEINKVLEKFVNRIHSVGLV